MLAINIIIIATSFVECLYDSKWTQAPSASAIEENLDSWKWEIVKPTVTPSPSIWSPRAGLQAAYASMSNSSILVMGGRTPLQPLLVPGVPIPIPISIIWNDVWRSDNEGQNWTQVSSSTPWPARAYFKAVSVKNAVVVLGGQNFKAGPDAGCPDGFLSCSDFFNDVWSSHDSGETWEELTPSAGWGPRAGLSAVMHGEALIVLGGSLNDDASTVPGGPPARIYYNDVWSSEDAGRTWTRLVENAPWTARAGAVLESKDGWLYLLGGEDGFTCTDPTKPCPPYFNDVWRSRDGAEWELVTANAGWSPRPGFACPVLESGDNGGQFVCFGGFGLPEGGNPFGPPSNPTDMWRSIDNGYNWMLMPQSAWNAVGQPELVKYDFASLVVGGKILTFGGDRETFNFFDPDNYLQVDNDVWAFGQE